jgi:hypothetical protein
MEPPTQKEQSMSIKIEVTGESLTEVADKLLAIGNSLRVTVSYAEDNAAREALQASRKGKTPPKKEPVADVGEPAASASETTEDTSVVSEEATSNGTETSTAPVAVNALDFDKDVAPVVISYVQSKGKPFVVGILEQFGVTKASELPEDRWGELLAALAG